MIVSFAGLGLTITSWEEASVSIDEVVRERVGVAGSEERSIVLRVPLQMLLILSDSSIDSTIVYMLEKMLRSLRIRSTGVWVKIFLDLKYRLTV